MPGSPLTKAAELNPFPPRDGERDRESEREREREREHEESLEGRPGKSLNIRFLYG